MKTTGRGADRSLRQRIYEQVEDLKAQGLRTGEAIATVAAQLGKNRATASVQYYAYRRKLAASSHRPKAGLPRERSVQGNLYPAFPEVSKKESDADRLRRIAERLDVVEEHLRRLGLEKR